VAWTVSRLLGRFDPAFIWDYALHTDHGRVTLVRVGLTPLVTALVLVSRLRGRLDRALFVLTSLGLLAFRGGAAARFGRVLKLEALLLLGVLAATGLLTTSALPHD
jgi:putative copper export protein